VNYRHAYHAGGFFDVFKHYVLMLLIQSLKQKEAGFTYIDTHSGSGLYDLKFSSKTLEAENGIHLLWNSKLKLTDSLQEYLDLIKKFQADNKLEHYPGSPAVVRSLLRAQDQMILNELHPEEAHNLKKLFGRDKQVHIHTQDAYHWIKGIIPPNPPRGLVFIDPPYEQKNEYEQLVKLLITSLKHWRQGVYAIWYPITKEQPLKKFYAELNKAGIEYLNTQLSVYNEDSPIGLNGSGMLIVNPPWQLDLKLKENLPLLWKILSPEGKGGVS